MIVTHDESNTVTHSELAMNEWPNPPWNTTRYEWDKEYPEDTPEWTAQHLAKTALRIGLKYTTRDIHAEQISAAREYREHQEQVLREQEEQRTASRNVSHFQPIRREETPDLKSESEQEGNAMEARPFHPTHGVLSQERLYMATVRNGKKPTPVTYPVTAINFTHVGDIYEVARKHNLQSVWILPGSELSELLTDTFVEATPEEYHATAKYTSVETGHFPKFIKSWKKGEKDVYIWVAENETRWGNELRSTTNEVTLYAAILYAEHALNMSLLYSPGYSGRELMKSHNTGKREHWVQECNHAGIPYEKVNDLSWKRALTAEERKRKHYIAYDKNSMYLGVCASLNLGEGTPVYEKSPQFDKKYPGLWYITLAGTSDYNGVTLPHPTGGKVSGWFLTPTVQSAIDCGYTVTTHEGYIWKAYHQTLRSWSDTVWNARQALNPSVQSELYPHKEARKLAYIMTKKLATQSIGWLDISRYTRGQGESQDESEQEEKEQVSRETGDTWQRPDFRRAIVEEAKHRIFARIKTLVEAGYVPVGVDVDALYFVTDDDNPETAIPQMLNYASGRGGYRHKYTVPLADVLPLLDSKMKMHAVNTAILNKFNLED